MEASAQEKAGLTQPSNLLRLVEDDTAALRQLASCAAVSVTPPLHRVRRRPEPTLAKNGNGHANGNVPVVRTVSDSRLMIKNDVTFFDYGV